MGEDPFAARMKVVEEELGIGGSSGAPQAPVRSESDFEERLRKYVPGAR